MMNLEVLELFILLEFSMYSSATLVLYHPPSFLKSHSTFGPNRCRASSLRMDGVLCKIRKVEKLRSSKKKEMIGNSLRLTSLMLDDFRSVFHIL
jgi:hypothetical protein